MKSLRLTNVILSILFLYFAAEVKRQSLRSLSGPSDGGLAVLAYFLTLK